MFDLLIEKSNTLGNEYDLIIISIVLAFALTSVIVLVLQYTTDDLRQSKNMMQGMILISIVATIIMQAIGDSIARGLGMLGALAIIRFRTPVNNPRNITFIFASLAIGIACGVYSFIVAIFGAIGFSIAALVLKFSYFSRKKELTGTLNVDVVPGKGIKELIETQLKTICSDFEIIEINYPRLKETVSNGDTTAEVQAVPRQELTYNLVLKDESDNIWLTDKIYSIDGVNEVKLRFNRKPDEI